MRPFCKVLHNFAYYIFVQLYVQCKIWVLKQNQLRTTDQNPSQKPIIIRYSSRLWKKYHVLCEHSVTTGSYRPQSISLPIVSAPGQLLKEDIVVSAVVFTPGARDPQHCTFSFFYTPDSDLWHIRRDLHELNWEVLWVHRTGVKTTVWVFPEV